MTPLDKHLASLSPQERAELLRRLQQEQARRSSSSPASRPTSSSSRPLSFAQQRLWFLDQLEPGSPFYNVPVVLRLQGALDVPALERSLAEVVRRHEPLRTTFRADGEQPVQVISPPWVPALAPVDLSPLSAPERQSEAHRLTAEEIQRPFDLARGPLLRLLLLRLDAQEHVMVVNMHHIVSDGWSMRVLVREVVALYGAFHQGGASPLPEPPLQYADYAEWQRQWLRGEVLERQLSYWRHQLEGAPAVLELPTDRPRPAARSYRGSVHIARLPRSLAQALQAFCQREGVTLFMALMAAFHALLHRYSGQRDLVVGTDVANRQHADTEGLIGFFVNQLVLRARLSPQPTFRELLEQVREASLQAYAHQDLPFEELVRALNPGRSLAHAPVFQHKLVLHNTPQAPLRLPGLELTMLGVDTGTTRLDLTVLVAETEDGLACTWRYSTDLYEAASIQRMARHFQRVLEGLLADPGQRLADLRLLEEQELHQVLREWNDTATPPPERCVHQLISEQAARTPEAVAVVAADGQLTYAELERRSNQLAHHLRSLGVGPEVCVGLFTERSVQALVGLLGILKAGGTWLPLEPAQANAGERLAFMLQDAHASLVVTQEHLEGELPALGTFTVCLDRDEALLELQPGHPPESGVTPGNLAYVIYTSGSTGRPKGVAIEHRQLAHYVAAATRRLRLPEGARFASVSTLAADLGHTVLFPSLCTGGSLQLVPRETAADASALAAWCERHPVDCLKIVPTHLAALLASPVAARLLPRQRLVFGGDLLEPAVVDQVHALAPDCAVFNHYGPTETTVGVVAWGVERGTPVVGASVPLGRPLDNVRLYVLDAAGQPVPPGIPGELYVGGAGVGRGYLGRPELTAERFVPDPFGDSPGARLYRTGDRVRWLAGGLVEFLGRVDHQVKLRGYRVELGEVEAVLGQHPAVQECVVVVREIGPGDKQLVAYVVPKPGQDASAESVRTFLLGRLPEYMVPAACVRLSALPLTPNGKVDRPALPAPEHERADDFIPPRSDTEQRLAELWRELLRVERVGASDNFFDLGGYSLLATQVVARIHAIFEEELAVIDLFEAPTLEELAARIDSRTRSRSTLVPLRRGGNRRPFFCVHPVSGTALCYLELARRLHPEQPFQGLQAPAPGALEEDGLEALAAHHVQAMRSLQPEGPYLLGGWSLGGRVAFEMARQLQQQGQPVGLLVLIDAWGSEPATGDAALEAPLLFAEHLSRQSSVHPLAAGLLARLGSEELGPLLEAGPTARPDLPGEALAELHTLWRTFSALLRASRAYQPRPYAGALTLLRATEALGSEPQASRDLGWGAVAQGGVEVSDMPGDHFTLLAMPHVEQVAARLQALLDRAHGADAPRVLLKGLAG